MKGRREETDQDSGAAGGTKSNDMIQQHKKEMMKKKNTSSSRGTKAIHYAEHISPKLCHELVYSHPKQQVRRVVIRGKLRVLPGGNSIAFVTPD
jgi:hypothetical protein